jgi:SAM-dependent methyltransferase
LGIGDLRALEGVMSVYRKFARIYTDGDYSDFSRKMCEYLPAALKALEARPTCILDIACGEGTFAVAATQLGYRVTGLDSSQEMLGCARERARNAGVNVNFVRADMRAIPFAGGFDLATCWFDSLNYLLAPGDLLKAFRGVAGALRQGGLFIFDMNTVHGLAVDWRENPCYIRNDTDTIFEVHRQDYDFETGVAHMHITGFVRDRDDWTRIDEHHRERAYPQGEIQACLSNSEFQVLASWGSFRDRSEPTSESPRVWYVAKSRSS